MGESADELAQALAPTVTRDRFDGRAFTVVSTPGASPDDVAALVRFLLGPESSWITGQCIGVDGGHSVRRGPDITPLMEMLFGAGIRPAGLPAD